MATLDVEFEAVSDTHGRFAHLARLLGLADADHARGKLEHLWMACTTRGELELPLWLVERTLGAGSAEALVESGLGRWALGRGDSDTRRLYIAGARKRCRWLHRNRGQSSKGGKTRADTARRVAGRFAPNDTNVDASKPPTAENESPESPAPSPSPSPEDQNLPPARDPAVPSPSPTPALEQTLRSSPPPAPAPPSETSLETLWSEFELERQRVAKSLRIELLPLAPHDRGRNDLAHALAAARQAGERELEVKRIRRAIAVAGAEAEGGQETQWLTGAVFTQDNLRRLSGTTPAKAKQASAERRAAKLARARGPNGKPEQPSMPTPPKFEPSPPARTAAELAADWAATQAELAGKPADMPTAELVKRFGDGQRAPPASAAPTNPDDTKPKKARSA